MSPTTRKLAFCVALALGCPMVSTAQLTTKTIVLPPGTPSCPVGLHARQGSNGDMLRVANPHRNEPGQMIQLSISDPTPSRQAVAAHLTVRGLAAKGRTVPAGNQLPADAQRAVDVQLTPGPDRTLTAQVWVPGVTTVQTIDLASLTLADGTTWKLPAESVCRTSPDGFMLIGAR